MGLFGNLSSSSGITIESVLWNIVQVCDQDMEVKVPEVSCEIQKEEKVTEKDDKTSLKNEIKSSLGGWAILNKRNSDL